MNLKGFIAAFIGAMFEAAWAYGLKHSEIGRAHV